MKELERDTEKEREQDGLEVYRREGKREGGGGEREREGENFFAREQRSASLRRKQMW